MGSMDEWMGMERKMYFLTTKRCRILKTWVAGLG